MSKFRECLIAHKNAIATIEKKIAIVQEVKRSWIDRLEEKIGTDIDDWKEMDRCLDYSYGGKLRHSSVTFFEDRVEFSTCNSDGETIFFFMSEDEFNMKDDEFAEEKNKLAKEAYNKILDRLGLNADKWEFEDVHLDRLD